MDLPGGKNSAYYAIELYWRRAARFGPSPGTAGFRPLARGSLQARGFTPLTLSGSWETAGSRPAVERGASQGSRDPAVEQRRFSRTGREVNHIVSAPAEPAPGSRVGGGRPVELSAGGMGRTGLTVCRMKLPPGARVVIISSGGVQAGERNLQLNHFRYTMRPTSTSVDDLLRWHPARQRALARVAADPGDAQANARFRGLLTGRSPWEGSRVRLIKQDHLRIVRTTARADESGRVIIRRSRFIQTGSRNTQHNHFSFRFDPPRHAFEALLRGNPRLVRALAVTARHPGSQAVQRSFHAQLTSAYELPAREIRRISVPAHGATRVAVYRGYGVQFGRHNIRREDVTADRPRVGPVRPARIAALNRLMPSDARTERWRGGRGGR
jgi:hypothetical protein